MLLAINESSFLCDDLIIRNIWKGSKSPLASALNQMEKLKGLQALTHGFHVPVGLAARRWTSRVMSMVGLHSRTIPYTLQESTYPLPQTTVQKAK